MPDPKADPQVGAFFARLPAADYLPTWHAQRQGGVMGVEEQKAANKAAQHADTPSVAHADSLGRTFLTVAHNRFNFSNAPAAEPVKEEFSATRVEFDIEGNQRAVRDAKVEAGDPRAASSCATSKTCWATRCTKSAWKPALAGCWPMWPASPCMPGQPWPSLPHRLRRTASPQ